LRLLSRFSMRSCYARQTGKPGALRKTLQCRERSATVKPVASTCLKRTQSAPRLGSSVSPQNVKTLYVEQYPPAKYSTRRQTHPSKPPSTLTPPAGSGRAGLKHAKGFATFRKVSGRQNADSAFCHIHRRQEPPGMRPIHPSPPADFSGQRGAILPLCAPSRLLIAATPTSRINSAIRKRKDEIWLPVP
jgi:hypothetical protein